MRAAVLFLCVGTALAQAPVFDVASVKPAKPGQQFGIIRMMPGNQTYVGSNVSLRVMMTVAYSVTDRQISGGPDWLATEPWDLMAKSERRHTADEMHDMLARLLEERFRMKIRREKRDMPVWALTIDKGGPKLTEHDPADLDHPPFGAGPGPAGRGTTGKNVSMQYFAFMLSRLLDRNVVDRTGLTKNYDLAIDFVRDLGPRPDGSAPPPQGDGPSVFTALKEQLGLKLEPARGPVEHLVVEAAQRPDAN